jgi:hypothetical protein
MTDFVGNNNTDNVALFLSDIVAERSWSRADIDNNL